MSNTPHPRVNTYQGIGLEHAPFESPQLENPYPFYARARREEPVFYNPKLDLWYVSRYEDVATVLKDAARFSSAGAQDPNFELPLSVREILQQGYPPTPSLVNNDPPSHTRVRRYTSKAFTAASMAQLEPRIRQLTNELIDGFIHEGRVDLIGRFSYPLPTRVILGIVGVPAEDADQIRQWSEDWSALFFAPMPVERQLECARSVIAYQRYMTELIEQRRRQPCNDLTSDMVKTALEDGSLSVAELVHVLNLVLTAGHLTTTNLIANCMYLLLTHPEQWAAVQKEPRLIPSAIEETLRYESPLLGNIRTTTETVELGGATLPKGSRLIVLFASGNRDESVIPEAERFNIQREGSPTHFAFGRGIHFCIGAALARLEGQIALEQLIKRLPGLRLAREQVLKYAPSLVHRGFQQLELEWEPQRPAAA